MERSVIPAAAAAVGMAYLDAKYHFAKDARTIVQSSINDYRYARAIRQNRASAWDRLAENAQEVPESVALWFEGKQWTWKELYETVNQYGAWFRQKGVKSGHLVAISLMNCPELIFCWWGLLSIAAAPALLNYNLGHKQVVHCLNLCDAKYLLFDSKDGTSIADLADDLAKKGIAVHRLDDAFYAELARMPTAGPEKSLRQAVTPYDASNAFFTSGTTGLPKATIWTLERWLRTARGYNLNLRLNPTDVFFTQMPLYHASASVGLHVCLWSRSCFALGRKFSASNYFKDAALCNATVIQYVGEICRYLLSSQPSTTDKSHNIRIAFGNGMKSDVWQLFKDRFNIPAIVEFYGATEGVSAMFNYSHNEFSKGAVAFYGKLVHFALGCRNVVVEFDWINEVPVRNEVGYCVAIKDGRPGELLQKIDASQPLHSFPGYFKDKNATMKKIITDVFEKGDMWFRSGDIMRYVHDGVTRWYFVDRIGDTFRWKAENVSTIEVEQVLGAFPGIAEATVYGVELPHHEGRAGCAAVVLKDSDRFDFNAFARYAMQQLPSYAVPLFLRITPK